MIKLFGYNILKDCEPKQKEESEELKELLKSALSWLPDSSKLRAGRYTQLQNLKRKIKEILK